MSTELNSGDIIKLVQCHLPPMTAGKYSGTVEQTIFALGGANKTEIPGAAITSKFEFYVDAARFTLNQSDIYSVYPPAGHSGDYSESLPHIVFSRRTLPWERTIDGEVPLFQQSSSGNPMKDQPIPWMALIVLEPGSSEVPKIQNSRVGEAIGARAAGYHYDAKILYPAIADNNSAGTVLGLKPWESLEDGCFTIDLSKEDFCKYVPQAADLPFLAHSKEVRISDKDPAGIVDINPDDTSRAVFAVVTGNRLTAKEQWNTVLLVSLEGFAGHLGEDRKIPDGIEKVRLVVLANWTYQDHNEGGTFSTLIDQLKIKSMQAESLNKPDLLAYYNMGYVGLEHLLRNGSRTVSWYHGPFIPQLSSSAGNISFSSADAALRYDQNTGLLDISFAAAWQLGRMLALQSQSFATALMNWRIFLRQNQIKSRHEADLAEILQNPKDISLREKTLEYLISASDTPLKTEPKPDNDTVPMEMKSFLGKLFRLFGVPFNYLVPHHEYLESNTMAFFYMDPHWVEALLDGALSLGRTNYSKLLLDKAMAGNFVPEQYDQYKDEHDEKLKKENILRAVNVTGFLIRSPLISGWRGITIQAFDATNQQLPAFRFERISNDILLGVFQGNIAHVVITQPYEGMHFGLKNVNGTWQKNLKNEDGANTVIQDRPNTASDLVEELRTDVSAQRVINVAKLASDMKSRLKLEDFTSSEFAFQMVNSPVRRTITIAIKQPVKA